MSIIQSIRDKGAWIIGVVIALALIAFILQDGLNKRGTVFGNSSNIAKVNGVAINKDEFLEKLDNITKANPQQQRDGIVNQLFDQEVNTLLLEQEFEKAGVACTDKQLSEEMFKPNSMFVQQFKDPKTGIADPEKAKQWFNDYKRSPKEEVKNQLFELIKQTVLNAKRNKYNTFFSQAAYAPKWLVEKQQADNNSFSSLSYVAVPYNTIADSTVKVSDDEIMAYAKKHSKLYEKDEETRSFQYVSFDAIPSATDSASAKNKVQEKIADLTAATNMEAFFAKNLSEMPYYNTHITGSAIQQKVKDTLFKLSKGSVYGPYVDGSNYVAAKMVDVISMPDSAKVRHILVKTKERDPQSGSEYAVRDDSTAKHLLDTIVMKLKAGANFDSICRVSSEDDGSKEKGGVYDYFPAGRMVASFNEFAFTKPVGTKDIIKTEFGYHYVEVLGQKGSSTAYNIAYFAKPIQVSTETDNDIKAQATKLISVVKNRKDFDTEVAKLQKQSMSADNVKKEDFNIGALGNNRQMVKWAYKQNVGDVTEEPYQFNNSKYVVAIITSVNKPGLPSAATLRPMVESLVKNEKKAKQIIAKMKGNTLEEMAASVGNTIVNRLDTLLATNPYNPMLGNDFKFAGAAFNASNKGKVTEPIAGQMGVFAVKVDNISAKPTTTPVDLTQAANMLSSFIKNSVYRLTSEVLKKAATITDNRSEVF